LLAKRVGDITHSGREYHADTPDQSPDRVHAMTP
jgi:hypothetical protein